MKKNSILFPLVFALFVTALVLAVYFYKQYQTLNKEYEALKQNPAQAVQAETKQLIAEVSQLIVLPEGEQPTVATVNDPEKLKDRPFFANAKKGFKLLIYTNAKKAILYDPVAKKIVDVAPVNIGENPAETAPSNNKK